MGVEMLWCAGCGGERGFEVPPCADGHGGDCPERACVECGLAVVVGLLVAGEVVVVPTGMAADAA